MKLTRLRCSFCGKKETEVQKLVAGPRVYICDACVAVANRLMADDASGSKPNVVPTVWQSIAERIRGLIHIESRRIDFFGG